ncbi:MAG: hypothetical protein K6G56_01715 [Clostridiales bacterium]|nr:hypothetical protein [Clostridiales bacterium]
MNILDFAIIAILGLFVLAGVYKGFLHTALDILCFMLCVLFAFLMTPLLSFKVEQNESLFNTMLYYTEGSEKITDVEYRKQNISEISNAELEDIYSRSEVAFPMDKRIRANVADAAFASANIYTLGEYYNQTMVLVTLNILVFLVLFAALRIALAFLIGWINYAHPLPVLRKVELPAAIGTGLIHGVLAVFLFFMVCPIILTVLPFDVVSDLVEGSRLARFFYYSNFLLGLIPGV